MIQRLSKEQVEAVLEVLKEGGVNYFTFDLKCEYLLKVLKEVEHVH